MFLGCQACFLELQAFFLGSSGIFYFYFHVSFWVLALISKVQIQCNRLRVAGNLEHGNQVPINFYPPCHDMGSLLYTSRGIYGPRECRPSISLSGPRVQRLCISLYKIRI